MTYKTYKMNIPWGKNNKIPQCIKQKLQIKMQNYSQKQE